MRLKGLFIFDKIQKLELVLHAIRIGRAECTDRIRKDMEFPTSSTYSLAMEDFF